MTGVPVLAQAPDPAKVSTKQVWPWSLLVPWMEADLRARAARLNKEEAAPGAKRETAAVDPYDNALLMPLREFLAAPIVADLLHNGAALQARSPAPCARPAVSHLPHQLLRIREAAPLSTQQLGR